MTRLATELQRLYFLPGETRLSFAGAPLRALVLELAAPAGWDAAARVWQGVQVDLALPAPAIAVSGGTGYQLWFSLAQAVPAAQAAAMLDALRRRYLGDVRREHVALHPAPGETRDPPRLPPEQVAPGRWSAFVAPDLAGVFGDEPWLDLPPSADAQADLLSRIQSITPADWQRAVQGTGPGAAADPGDRPAQPASAPAAPAELDPRRFLLATMNDPSVELHLRIEAAKALLPYSEARPSR